MPHTPLVLCRKWQAITLMGTGIDCLLAVAGRMRERYGRPVIAFADASSAAPDDLKGSTCSIPALHIRDAIADCAAA